MCFHFQDHTLLRWAPTWTAGAENQQPPVGVQPHESQECRGVPQGTEPCSWQSSRFPLSSRNRGNIDNTISSQGDEMFLQLPQAKRESCSWWTARHRGPEAIWISDFHLSVSRGGHEMVLHLRHMWLLTIACIHAHGSPKSALQLLQKWSTSTLGCLNISKCG